MAGKEIPIPIPPQKNLQINFNKSGKEFCGHLVQKILSLVACVFVKCVLCNILMAFCINFWITCELSFLKHHGALRYDSRMGFQTCCTDLSQIPC